MGAPGGAHGKGCEQQPPDRREGGLLLAPLGGAGRIFGSPLGGARARGAHGKLLSSRRAIGAYRVRPWVGRGKIAAGKAIVPPNYGGEGG